MPDPKDNAQRDGDAQPAESENTGAAADESDEVEATPGKGENQAGFLKDRDAAGG